MIRPHALLLLAFSSLACASIVEPAQESSTGDGDSLGDGDDSGDGDGDVMGSGGVVIQSGAGGSAAGGSQTMSGGATGSGGAQGSGGQPMGPLLFQDDFESGLGKWTTEGTWSESTDGTTVLLQERLLDGDVIDSDDRGYYSAFAGGPNWVEYTLSGRVKLVAAEDNSNSYAGFLICASAGGTGIVVGFKGTGEVRIRSVSNGQKLNEGSSTEDLGGNELVISQGTWYAVEVILLAGGTLQLKIDGEYYAAAVPEGYSCNPGGIGLVTERASAVFDDIYVSTE